MSFSRVPRIVLDDVNGIAVSRTPGPLGINDHGDPNLKAIRGDTPGPLGINDHADPHYDEKVVAKTHSIITKWDPLAAAAFLKDARNGWAGTNSKGRCARAVRQAINAGHIATPDNPIAAAEYNDYLPTLGFVRVAIDGYIPRIGDIAVFPAVDGHIHGHIQMFTGEMWQSDYVQGAKTSVGKNSFFANRIWISKPYAIFRR